jgi:uncharacterized membrane protein YhaH (DUF805 family)
MSEPGSTGPAPGWYPDPDAGQGVRYWDGSMWSTYRRDTAPPKATALVGEHRESESSLDTPDGQPYVSLTRAVALVFRQYAVFRGRASRSEYWWWVVFGIFVDLVLAAVGRLILHSGSTVAAERVLVWIQIIVALVFFVPQLAVATRRLHDMGFSGSWLFLILPVFVPIRLIALIGFICVIVLNVFLAMPSQQQDNKYGPPPRKGKTPNYNSTPDLI